MPTRPKPQSGIPPRLQRSHRLVLVVVALSLFTMPQSYRGGAEFAHPHALFQFWIAGGHAAAHHHGHEAAEMSSAGDGTPTVASIGSPETPTISQMTASAERADAIGGAFTPWLILLMIGAAGIYLVGPIRSGRFPTPLTPPPRLLTSSLVLGN